MNGQAGPGRRCPATGSRPPYVALTLIDISPTVLGVTDEHSKPSVLFACRANAGRSVAGKVLAEHYAGDGADIYSAGSEPGEHVHPEVAAVLADLGLSTEAETPKPFDPAGQYTVVITMGCGESCPVYLGARYEDWAIEDPKGMSYDVVRRIVADIDGRVRRLLGALLADRPLPPSVFDGSVFDGSVVDSSVVDGSVASPSAAG